MAEVASVAALPNGHASSNVDDDAQAQVIASLRAQVGDLFTQVGQLNGKLVSSYDRVSDLEDSLHARTESLKSTADRVRALEAERSQHLSDLSAGLLVEKSHVTAELTRLMDRATDEAARRGQAESAKATIETELGELSTNLFEQANHMVKLANVTRDQAERRAAEAEEALHTAEEAVGGMQVQMQLIRSERDRLDGELKSVSGKGKWVERLPDAGSKFAIPKLISSHLPYEEFLMFMAHLRTLRPQPVPAMSSLLPLPFLARIVTEDSDPALRLDLAPALNWLSRRAVTAAVHAGTLDIVPTTTGGYLLETSSGTMAAPSSISCALCGKKVVGPEFANARAEPRAGPVPAHRSSGSVSGSWGGVFKPGASTASLTNGNATPSASRQSSTSSTSTRQQHPAYQTQLFVFRVVANSATNTYALCNTGWCLPRLRATCALWHFVRTGIVEHVWEEEMPSISPLRTKSSSASLSINAPPPVPPRRHAASTSISLVGHIGNMVRTASGGNSNNDTSNATQQGSISRKSSGVGSLFGMLAGSNSRSPVSTNAPPLPTKSTTAPSVRSTSSSSTRSVSSLTPTREKPSMNRTPSGGTVRSPTLGSGTVARRRPSGTQAPPERRTPSISNSQSKPPVPSHGVKPSLDLKGTASVLSPVENGIDEHGPPAEVMFDNEDQFKSPVVGESPEGKKAQEDESPVAPADVPIIAQPAKSQIASPSLRPMSASGVPLPMSPPTTPEPTTPGIDGTPKAAAVNGHTPKNSISAVPARTASPANGRAGSPAHGRAGSPAPTTGRASPAAPPLPKRAAGRRRAPTLVKSEAPTPVPGSPTAEKADPILKESKEEAPAPDADAPTTTTDAPVPVEEAAAAAAPETTLTATPLVSEPVSDEPAARKPALPARPLALQQRGLTVDSSLHALDSPLLSALPISPAFEPPPAVPPKASDSNENSDSPKEAWEQFVGDATWEERTWKEVVRLREEMFWARTGCVRE